MGFHIESPVPVKVQVSGSEGSVRGETQMIGYRDAYEY